MNLKDKLTPNKYYVFIIVFIIYIGSFLLIAYDNNLSFLGSSAEFFKAMVNTFQGAGAIAIITTILIFYQSKIQSNIDRDKKVFDEKIKLIKDLIGQIEIFIRKDDKSQSQIDAEELKELYFWQLKIGLLCKKETVQSFGEILFKVNHKLKKNESGIYEDLMDDLVEFVTQAREDIGIVNVSDSEDIFTSEINERDKENQTGSLGSQIFDFEAISDKDMDPKTKNNVEDLYKSIISQLGENNIDSIYSKTGGCTIRVKSRKLLNIVPKNNFVELLITRDYKEQYIRPEIEGLDISDIRKYDPTYANHTLENPHPSYTVPWGYAFYKIKLDYAQISEYENKINELVQSGYNTIIDGKVLKVTIADHQRLKNIYK